MTAAVWLPSDGELLAWCAQALTVLAVLTVVAFLALGATGRKWNR